MIKSIKSDITEINKSCADIEKELSDICAGEIIRWVIVEIKKDKFVVNYSYKTLK